MNKYVIDAYAWVEYFEGSLLGEKVKEIIEHPSHNIYTNLITFAELASYFERKGFGFTDPKQIILSLSNVYPLDIMFVQEAGKLHAEIKKERKHMSLADVFVLHTARKLHAKVVTGDQDFKGLKEVMILK